MSKKLLTIKDIGDSGYKILSTLTKWMMVSEIASETGLSNTTIRRVIQRLETFGLVREELQYSESNGVASSVQSKHFNLTKEGRAFLKQANKHGPKTKVIDTTIDTLTTIDMLEDFSDKVFNEPSQKIDLVTWLRQKAQELNSMADDLSVYEE
jgi:predicted ArsR family transcriptional regulator